MDRHGIIDALYAAYHAGDAASAAKLYAPFGVHEEAASGRARTGRPAIEAGLQGFLGMLEDLRFDLGDRVEAGDNILVNYVMTGQMTRPIGPFPAHGGSVKLQGAHLFRFEADEIQHLTDFWSLKAFTDQLHA